MSEKGFGNNNGAIFSSERGSRIEERIEKRDFNEAVDT